MLLSARQALMTTMPDLERIASDPSDAVDVLMSSLSFGKRVTSGAIEDVAGTCEMGITVRDDGHP